MDKDQIRKSTNT